MAGIPGAHVTLIAPGAEDTTIEGIRILHVKKATSRLGRMTATCSQVTWKALRLRANVYHFHDPELLPWMMIIRALRPRARIIFDVHEVPEQLGNKPWIPRPLRKTTVRLYLAIDRLLTQFVHHIIAAGPSCLAPYRTHPSVTMVRNYPLTERFIKEDRITDSSKRNEVEIIYLGVVAEQRGVLNMIEAASILAARGVAPFRLSIVGPATPEFAQEVHAAIARRSLEKIVSLEPPIPHEEVPERLAQADIALAVSLPKPQNVSSLHTKLFEYMLAKLPLVASDFPVWRSLLNGSRAAILVDPAAPDSIAAALATLAADEKARAEMGTNGRNYVLSRFSWDSERAELLRTYATAVPGMFTAQ